MINLDKGNLHGDEVGLLIGQIESIHQCRCPYIDLFFRLTPQNPKIQVH